MKSGLVTTTWLEATRFLPKVWDFFLVFVSFCFLFFENYWALPPHLIMINKFLLVLVYYLLHIQCLLHLYACKYIHVRDQCSFTIIYFCHLYFFVNIQYIFSFDLIWIIKQHTLPFFSIFVRNHFLLLQSIINWHCLNQYPSKITHKMLRFHDLFWYLPWPHHVKY